jgi:hypothetical protein
LGFDVTVLSGAHSTYDSGSKTAVEVEREVEDRLRALGAQIVPFDEAIKAWEKEGRIC